MKEVKIFGFNFLIENHPQDSSVFIMSEKRTGIQVGIGYSRISTIKNARERINEKGRDTFRKAIEKRIELLEEK